MRRSLASPASLAVAVVLLSACVRAGIPVGVTVPDPLGPADPAGPVATPGPAPGNNSPALLEDRAEIVFLGYGIPVAERFQDGRVLSGPFTVGPTWDGASVEARVTCGDDDGVPRARGRTVELNVVARIDRRPHGTRVTVSSTGHALPSAEQDDDDDPGCRLTREFAGVLVHAIVGTMPGGRGWITPAPIAPPDAASGS